METRIIKIDVLAHHAGDSRDTNKGLLEAAELIKQDEVVAFPTETVYGLGASAYSDAAVGKIYKAKNRPPDNPLIVHVCSEEMLSDMGVRGIKRYRSLLDTHWPGPLTILLELDEGTKLSRVCTHGQRTVAVRMPNSPIALSLIEAAGLPLAAPSANTSTRPSPTKAQHVYDDLEGRIALILDGGQCRVGIESTVVDGLVDPPEILRPGGLHIDAIRQVSGWERTIYHNAKLSEHSIPRTPGMKYKHYSPAATVILFEDDQPDSAFLKSHKISGKIAICRTLGWSEQVAIDLAATDVVLGINADEVAHNLFETLRRLDHEGHTHIMIEGMPEARGGAAVMNRIRKAATLIV